MRISETPYSMVSSQGSEFRARVKLRSIFFVWHSILWLY
ncbi:hypothetical protein SCOCK_490004 [Actinacidiphila cocklensis]|uniref:Uncharacterized protein n=1 Tax=Actinacidiphila cocklensis TaxID=887465 RepID=A0A9W4DVW2_9ACTN|nr:hypothetical protein SCOCK_490004 [Actinacidiphila cocklensis]